jgi:hypothetical protein
MATVEKVNAKTGERMIVERELPPDLPPTLDELLAYAAERRWLAETGGVVVAGIHVATDDRSQRKISELRRRAELGEIRTPFGFKADNGWMDLDLPSIVTVDRVVATHVQACYVTERTLVEGITADKPTITTKEEIDAAFAALALVPRSPR